MQLQRKFPTIVGWHCFNYQLELGVNDAVKSCSEINYFKAFMDKLSLYSMSMKNQCAFRIVQPYLAQNRIGKVLDVCWVSSSYRAVCAVWRSYDALYKHFSEAAVVIRHKRAAPFFWFNLFRKQQCLLATWKYVSAAVQKLSQECNHVNL